MSRERSPRPFREPWHHFEQASAGCRCDGCGTDGGPLGVRSVPIFAQRAPYQPAELFAVAVCLGCYRSRRKMIHAMGRSAGAPLEARHERKAVPCPSITC